MLKTDKAVEIQIYPPSQQGRGAFDGGKITEIKPIGFPGDGATVKRVGPLFYWAWASSEGPARIGLHPHQAFEIMSYVLDGELAHYDTLGGESWVGKGGVQVMQTGSGVSHAEGTAAQTHFFQIWFEPYLSEAIKRPPAYHEYPSDAFPMYQQPGVLVKQVIGKGAPVNMIVDATMQDVILATDATYTYSLAAGRSLAAMTIGGQGNWQAGEQQETVQALDFAVINAAEETVLRVYATSDDGLRLVLIEVPTHVDYPLYPK